MLNLGELNFVLSQSKNFHSLYIFLYCKAWLCKWILRFLSKAQYDKGENKSVRQDKSALHKERLV